MTKFVSEDDVEKLCLEHFKTMGYTILYGPNIAPDGATPERKTYTDVVLLERLKKAVDKINPHIPIEARDEAIKKLLRTEKTTLLENNRAFHHYLVNGIDIEYRKDNRIKGDKVYLFDYKHPEHNDYLAVNQFTIIENNHNRRPDIILFINGLPLVVIELKNPADQEATVFAAYNQLQTYKEQIPSLFKYNEILVISDGLEALAGTITSNKTRFMKWKTIDGTDPPQHLIELEILLKGMFTKNVLLDLLRHFIVFEDEKEPSKKLAAYHQYHAVNKAIQSTKNAIQTDKKAGVIWHTQGSGKSLIMVFYTGKLVLEFDNPTIVILNDRNDLDGQLFGTFSRCQEILRQQPVQAETREDLKKLLKVSSGGVVFTTIQKFYPEENRETYPLLSDRHNIIVIADEAHRTQYGFKAKIQTKDDQALITYGYAKYVRDALPNASFIGFTGTPIEKEDRSTPAVFGKYVDIYDIKKAVDDKATVRIFYESRLAKLELKPEERPRIDPEFEIVTEGEEEAHKEYLKSKWARMEKIIGSPKRIERIAKDIVQHFEQRLEALDGKAMIVCASRRICVDLYNEIIKQRPHWEHTDDDKGELKVIMTGSAADPKEWQEHIRNKKRRMLIAERMKDPNDPLKLVIVRDMWLTGFDVPSLHTMYIDKPMRGHGLMQAIARVNRIFKDKEGGLIVDYLGIGAELKKALMDYTHSGGEGKPIFEQEEAVALMEEKYEIVENLFHGFNYKKFFELGPQERLQIIPQAIEHILKQKDGKKRYIQHTTELLKAYSLAVPHQKALKIREDVGFYQAIKSTLTKTTSTTAMYKEDLDTAINQILSKAIISDRVVDIFEAAGIQKPDLAILSDEFLAEVQHLPQKNLAFEILKKLLNDQIRIRMKKNIVQARSFREMLENTVMRYTNRSIEAAEVIEELIKLAKKLREEDKRGEELKLNEDELAFYDALMVNDSAVKILGNETLRKIALELTDMIRNNVTIDWTLRENVQAKLRVNVKRILKKYGYPPDKQKKATELVLQQAEVVAKDWAE
ncbi:MAG: type I restriction endonuclease subunit R [Candidatus Thermoplasmatota archaeon]